MSIIYGSEQYTWSFNSNYVPSKKSFNLATSENIFSVYNNLKNNKQKILFFSDSISFNNL